MAYTLLAPVFFCLSRIILKIFTPFLLKKFAGVNICCIFTLSN